MWRSLFNLFLYCFCPLHCTEKGLLQWEHSDAKMHCVMSLILIETSRFLLNTQTWAHQSKLYLRVQESLEMALIAFRVKWSGGKWWPHSQQANPFHLNLYNFLSFVTLQFTTLVNDPSSRSRSIGGPEHIVCHSGIFHLVVQIEKAFLPQRTTPFQNIALRTIE